MLVKGFRMQNGALQSSCFGMVSVKKKRSPATKTRAKPSIGRVDRDHLEWSVTIDDPKMYTAPWVALDKPPFYLQPPSHDVREMICSPSESTEYDKLIGNPASDKPSK